MSSPSSKQGLQIVLGLFRRILRVHRQKLPPPLRSVGDTYVREEFSQHLRSSATTSKQWRQFIMQWQDYALALEGKADRGGTSTGTTSETGPDSLEQALHHLSPEQMQTLGKVREATTQLGQELTSFELAVLLKSAEGDAAGGDRKS